MWGRLSDLFGNRLILLTTGGLIPLMPVLWLVSTDYFYILAVQATGGLLWAGFTLSASNYLTPSGKRATFMAAHNVLVAAAVFAGAMVGGWLGTHLPREVGVFGTTYGWLTPLYGVFIVSAVARGAVVVLLLRRLQEVRRVRPMSPGGLIFRVTRVQPVAGLKFEVLGRSRPGSNQ